MVSVALLAPLGLSAQLSYSHTTLVHGFNDNSYRFKTPQTAALLGPRVNLKQVQIPDLNGSLSIDNQAINLRPWLVGSHVLAGLSMGGLTSRAAYFQNPSNIAGIVTIATPHGGAPIADNAGRVTGFAANIVVDYFNTVISIFYKPTPGSILNAVAVGIIHGMANDVLKGVVKRHLDEVLGVNSEGRRDIMTNSPTVARL